MESIHPLYTQFWPVITSPLLKEVHTYTYRTKDYMLSSAVDYRPGMRSNQTRPWQATIAETAIVFTQQPSYLPVPEGQEPPAYWNWQSKDEPGPGYWTGDSSVPRIGQSKNVAIIIYAPQYAPKPMGLKDFDYRNETHAYFPHSGFDEVVQAGNWAFGRKDNGYVALYSHRPVAWRSGQPEVYENGGKPFDLVADGGAENVWIVELGSLSEWGSFDAFKAGISAAGITVTPLGTNGDTGFSNGYDVSYMSPKQGEVKFGWSKPLTVAGENVELKWDWRYDNPFVKAPFNGTRYDIKNGPDSLVLDFDKTSRVATLHR
jgi:hypothetical protein